MADREAVILEQFQAFGLVHPQTTLFPTPLVVRLLVDSQFFAHQGNRHPLSEMDFGFPEFRNDLFG